MGEVRGSGRLGRRWLLRVHWSLAVRRKTIREGVSSATLPYRGQIIRENARESHYNSVEVSRRVSPSVKQAYLLWAMPALLKGSGRRQGRKTLLLYPSRRRRIAGNVIQ